MVVKKTLKYLKFAQKLPPTGDGSEAIRKNKQ